jgi:hypothetical protein
VIQNTSPSLCSVSSHRKGSWGNAASSGLRPQPIAEERAVLREMPRRLSQDAAHQIEPVVARGQRQARLVTVLGWQARHAARIDIGRVAEDEIVAPAGEGLEEIAAMERDAVVQAMRLDVAAGERQSAGRQIGGGDAGLREDQRRQDGEAARAGADRARA